MSHIYLTVGPPGSGKSRWAHEIVTHRGMHEVQRVNLDDFLTMTHGRQFGELSGDDLKLTRRMLVNVIRSIAESGRDVIVDNTHLSTRFPNQVRDELGDEHEYSIQDFTGVPLETCIERDRLRAERNPAAYVGHDDVMKLWNTGQSLRQRFGGDGLPIWAEELNRSDGIQPYVPDLSLHAAVIVDVDGTLALNDSRSPYDTSRYHEDKLEHRLSELIMALNQSPRRVQAIVLTGREQAHRGVLYDWFEKLGVHWDECYMRSDGDTRRDNVVKLELFNHHVRHRFNVVTAFDDRDRVVRLWRRLGLLTCQVQWGDF